MEREGGGPSAGGTRDGVTVTVVIQRGKVGD